MIYQYVQHIARHGEPCHAGLCLMLLNLDNISLSTPRYRQFHGFMVNVDVMKLFSMHWFYTSTSHRDVMEYKINTFSYYSDVIMGAIAYQLPYHCLLNRLFRRRSKKTSKLRVTGLSAVNSPVTVEFPAQMASYAENVSIWWSHNGQWWIRPIRIGRLPGSSISMYCALGLGGDVMSGPNLHKQLKKDTTWNIRSIN